MEGVIKQLTSENRSYYTAEEVQTILDVSKSKAYDIIRDMRKQLITEGKLARQYPTGKIPKRYFDDQCMIN